MNSFPRFAFPDLPCVDVIDKKAVAELQAFCEVGPGKLESAMRALERFTPDVLAKYGSRSCGDIDGTLLDSVTFLRKRFEDGTHKMAFQNLRAFVAEFKELQESQMQLLHVVCELEDIADFVDRNQPFSGNKRKRRSPRQKNR